MSETYRCSECGRVYDNDDVCPECGCPASYMLSEDFPADEVDLDLEEFDPEEWEDEEEELIEELLEDEEFDEEFDDELSEGLTEEDILDEEGIEVGDV